MSKRIIVTVTVIAAAIGGSSVTRAQLAPRRAPGAGVMCLHDSSSTTADRLRQQEGLNLGEADQRR